MNKVILHGRIGTEPEIKNFDNGKLANFSLATDESYKDKQGQKVEKTEWHSITANGKLADVAEQYFNKGSELIIEGKLKTRSWEKDGQKFYKTEIIMYGFDFCGSKSDKPQPKPEDYKAPEQSTEEEDDLPF